MLQLILFFLVTFDTISGAKYKYVELSAEAQFQILNDQNNLRSFVAKNGNIPRENNTAANMMKLRYNMTLGFDAFVIANSLESSLRGSNMSDGVTVYYEPRFVTDIQTVVADGRKRAEQGGRAQCQPDELTRLVYRDLPEWMQTIWAKSSKFGCGVHRWTDRRTKGNNTVLVCKYDMSAKPGFEIFKVGKPCSNCPVGSICEQETKLCVVQN